MNDLNQLAELSPISDAEAGQFVSERTHADIVAAITSTSATSSAAKRTRGRRTRARRACGYRSLVAGRSRPRSSSASRGRC